MSVVEQSKSQSVLDKLNKIRAFGGERLTEGLSDAIIQQFAAKDSTLEQAVDDAIDQLAILQESYADYLHLDEVEQIAKIQEHYVNFYAHDAVNPYVSLAGRGPWVVTSKGAIIHDSGGYGMLGQGHAPEVVLAAMSQPHVMANIMTANFSQLRLIENLQKEIGHKSGGCKYAKFLCLNSGSESVTMAARISDVNSKIQTDPGGKHEGKTIKILALKGAFHGRTDRPGRFSDSTRPAYVKNLASFRDFDNLITITPNSIEELNAVFERADSESFYIEAFFAEPVMGEGDPGMAMTPEFYARARELTRLHNTTFLIDSIQAGLRAQGCLSITDYPGFENLDAPDLETYSKALNAGQYPLSVLAMSADSAALYRKGIYGNTMTTNPRAMDVACSVLEAVTPALRKNIVDRGNEFITKLEALKAELGGAITKVQGTGLLFSCELDPRYKAYGAGSIEEYLRTKGIGVIHGGENSLRYTPHFSVTSEEVDLIVNATKEALLNGPGSL